MDTYSIFREFADSWGLLGMFLFFIGAVLMLFRPGAKALHKDAANIPFNEKPCRDDFTGSAQIAEDIK
ncbi:cbb3-type cytochrome c oxidase subunit 3 [Amylibacter sp. SFDW26]|uniref:cbb3-type cytochrome c oxidase subunit 3 n=1 Tax=Amylibacter sp. SFDW26 TaxID=2652722 RepID=UPI001262447B|nr:cbb3-type cytochrome c oxidase subunit 3 [Amylibacter sp. SFDW26]KAB7614283.1 cbb3-type cytochrome c oxidase subunit 3 [Amylibacter sp. SFDW26]